MSDDALSDLYQTLKFNQLDSIDVGKSFYDALINGVNGLKLIDFKNFSNNTFNVVTELTYANGEDEFRPDITILVNGMPLAFIEVKKPNNHGGIATEYERINKRFSNPKFNRFANITQFMIFSNNMEYDDIAPSSLQGAFYATPAIGKDPRLSFNHFREGKPSDFVDEISEIDSTIEQRILDATNTQVIKNSQEYQTNLDLSSPTNQIISGLLSKPRLEFILKYAFAFITEPGKDPQRHIMRYPQLFATKAISATLDSNVKKGVIWHTQGSGKTALAYYNVKYLSDYYNKQNKVAKFYFIVDRLDLLNQAVQEFTKRGLHTRTVSNKDELEREFASTSVTTSGNDEICVINIQKFRDDTVAGNHSGYDDINIQRIYFIDEAHRSYDPHGSYLANLYNSDTSSVKIALTGTPLIAYSNHASCNEYEDDPSEILDRKTTTNIFGNYIHKYYYTDSIKDGYTVRLLRETVETSYAEQAKSIASNLDQIQVERGELKKKDLYANPKYVEPLLDYVISDYTTSKQLHQLNIGGMMVCHSSSQAREAYRQLVEHYPSVKGALILCDEGTKETRKKLVDDFKSGAIDILIVYNMLLTGFDAPRLKKLYMCRIIKAHNLLQALTRVNRPFKNMRAGYVVDFAGIYEEFEVTNEHYLAELNNEYKSGIDVSDGDVFGALFISDDEIERRIRDIRISLSSYPTDNAEEYSRRISALYDKSELNRLATALRNARDLYNLIRINGNDELLNKLDFSRLNYEYRETTNRIDLINAQEALSNDTGIDNRRLLDLAIEDVVFDFNRVDTDELQLGEAMSGARDLMRKVREAFNDSLDYDDKQLVSLRQEFRSLLNNADMQRREPHSQYTPDELDEITRQLQNIYERVQRINRRDRDLAAKYNGDAKYALLDKSLELNDSISPTNRHIFLRDAKKDIDLMINNNENIVENRAYLTGQIKKAVDDASRDMNLGRSSRVYASDKLADLYIKQYEEE